jgi:hypothetical protein
MVWATDSSATPSRSVGKLVTAESAALQEWFHRSADIQDLENGQLTATPVSLLPQKVG